MATTTQQQNQESSRATSRLRRLTDSPILTVLLAGLVGALVFSVKIQAGLTSLNIGDHVAIIAANPVGVTLMGIVVWLFVGIPAAGGVFLANTSSSD